jgi:hypothetical protein
MRRQVFEFMDLPWFPSLLRDFMTDYLRHACRVLRIYEPFAPLLRHALQETKSLAIVDLCSGAGGGVVDLLPALGSEVRVTLTDLYPNLGAFAALADAEGRIRHEPTPVDATSVPAHLAGVRTLFSCFHHFPPPLAHAILADATRSRAAICVCETTGRSWRNLASMLTVPFLVLAVTPLIRPFRWSRLLWTYLVPLVPLLILWDGMMSCLRTYAPSELEALARDLEGFHWRAGTLRHASGVELTYLVGLPEAPTA